MEVPLKKRPPPPLRPIRAAGGAQNQMLIT